MELQEISNVYQELKESGEFSNNIGGVQKFEQVTDYLRTKFGKDYGKPLKKILNQSKTSKENEEASFNISQSVDDFEDPNSINMENENEEIYPIEFASRVGNFKENESTLPSAPFPTSPIISPDVSPVNSPSHYSPPPYSPPPSSPPSQNFLISVSPSSPQLQSPIQNPSPIQNQDLTLEEEEQILVERLEEIRAIREKQKKEKADMMEILYPAIEILEKRGYQIPVIIHYIQTKK